MFSYNDYLKEPRRRKFDFATSKPQGRIALRLRKRLHGRKKTTNASTND